MKSLLSFKMKNNQLKIIDNLKLEQGKTKELLNLLKNVISGKDVLLVLASDDVKIKRAARNIPNMECEIAKRLNSNLVYRNEQLLICRDALKILEDWLV